MRVPLRHRLLAVVATVAVALVAPPSHRAEHNAADGNCPAGTNWDNIRKICL